MTDETYITALESTLNEIQNLCPDITNALIFNEEGKIIADKKTPQKTISRIIALYGDLLGKDKVIGGVEHVALEASKGRIYVAKIDSIHLLTVTSKKADIRFINTVTRLIFPAVLRLLEKISPTPLKSHSEIAKEDYETEVEETQEPFEEVSTETPPEETVESDFMPEPPIHQLMVENIRGGLLGGLLTSSDTVNIDSAILSQWENLCENRKVDQVEIETFDGKKIQCKVKPIKDPKRDGKGVIQIPEKIQTVLNVKKGELVRVKPVIY